MTRTQGARLLRFRVGNVDLALPVARVGRLSEPAELRRVPLAPPAVLGVCESNGRPVTVIDIALLLGGERQGEPCLVSLARPFEHTALLVHGPMWLAPAAAPQEGVELIDPAALTERILSVAPSIRRRGGGL